MKLRARARLILMIVPFAALVLLSCRNQPAESPRDTTASTPPPAAAPAEPATTAPAGDQTAAAIPPPSPPPERPPVSTPKPAPAPKPEAPPRREPEPVAKTIPAGTDLNVELIDAASSLTSQVGATVRARVTQPVVIDGLTVVPQGAIAKGTVTEAISLKKIGGTASLGLKFDSIELEGTSAAISAVIRQQGKSETGKDAGTIAGAAAGGALLGRLLSKDDKTKGTLIGAAVGAAAGTGVAAATKGKEVELPAGTPLAIRLDQPLTIAVRP